VSTQILAQTQRLAGNLQAALTTRAVMAQAIGILMSHSTANHRRSRPESSRPPSAGPAAGASDPAELCWMRNADPARTVIISAADSLDG
jgi:hypothetical protein